ncbi:hypothetical protein Tco_0381789 [Tanacetum coccineum]
MTLDIHNWSSFAHQDIHKIVKDEIFPIINQVDARVQNFKIQFLKEAAKFVRDFKSLAKEADESMVKQKALELEIEHLLREVVSKDIMSIVQNPTVVETSDLQTELEHTLDPLPQQLENENVELEFQIRNYEKENAHLKAVYKNLFDSINVTRAQTKTIIDSLQNKLHDTIYENAKLRAQLFDKVSEQKDMTKVPPKVVELNDLSNPITSNSVPTTNESKVVENNKVITPGMFRIDPYKTSREVKFVPVNKFRASIRTNAITVSQPHVITKKEVNSDSNGLSSIGVDNTAKTRRPQPRSNTKNDRVPSASKSSCSKNKEVKVEEHPRNLLLSKNKKHMSFECNNIKLAIRNDKSKVICAMCCSKHMTENLKLLINFVWKFLGIVRFRNDHVAAILGFSDLQWGNILITRVYFIEGLGHNLFLVGQFCDSDLEVAFRRNTYFVRNLEGVDLLKGNRTTNLYIIYLHEMAYASLICLMARATSTKSYVDRKPNCKELKKYILQGPYVMTKVTIPAQPATENEPAVPTHKVPEIHKNITLENGA